MNYILGQIIGIIAFIISLIAYHYQEKKKILSTSIISNTLKLIHYLLLGATSGGLTKLIAILRDFIIIKKEKYKFLSSNILFFDLLILYVLISFLTYKNILSLLPIIASLTNFIPVWNGNTMTIKKAAFFCYLFWLIYDISISSISGIISHTISILSIFLTIIKSNKLLK